MTLMFLAPRGQSFSSIIINALWAFIAWIIGSVLILILTYFISNVFNVVSVFETGIGTKISPLFPFILSLITLLGTTVTSFLTYKILNMTDGERYRKNNVLFGQLAFFQLVCYILMTPLYIYTWTGNFQDIMYVYLFHTLLIVTWTSLLLDIFNNHRYILIGFYGTIIALFFSIIFSIFIFSSFSAWFAKIIILLVLLPLSNFTIMFIKQIFELLYYYYYKFTSLDPLWDILYQVEMEEERKVREEEEKNSI